MTYCCCAPMWYMMEVSEIGMTLITHLSSSTCCILQRFHGFAADPLGLILSSGVCIAALSRKLKFFTNKSTL